MPWVLAVVAGLAVFLILAQTIGRRFRRALGNNDIAFWLISQRILPPIAVVIPLFVLYQQVGLLDTQFAMAITYVASNLPIAVWLMRDYFVSLPIELEESAWSMGHRACGSSGPSSCRWPCLVWWRRSSRADLVLERVPHRKHPLERQRADDAHPGGRPGRDPRAAVVDMSVRVRDHDRAVVVMAMLLERYISRGLLVGALKG